MTATTYTAGARGSGQRILVVDDDPRLLEVVRYALSREGFEIDEAGRWARAALAACEARQPDSCRARRGDAGARRHRGGWRIRQRFFEGADPLPVVLTRRRRVDCALGLEFGGDDYVTKPFSLAEIVARTQAILRRTAGDLPGRRPPRSATSSSTRARHEVFRGEAPIALTATEFSLLRYFMLNPRRVSPKGQILQNVWHYDFGGNANVVETVSYLRKKLDAAGPPLIKTVRQAGYMLEAVRG